MQAQYTITAHLEHCDQCVREALAWHTAARSSTTPAELLAFEAGYREAWRKSRNMIALHAGLSLADPKRESRRV